MKQFACGDVVPGCAAVFQAETEFDLLAKVATHARADHKLMAIPASLVDQVRARIVEAAA
jgi:predicted small metal-binding protein